MDYNSSNSYDLELLADADIIFLPCDFFFLSFFLSIFFSSPNLSRRRLDV